MDNRYLDCLEVDPFFHRKALTGKILVSAFLLFVLFALKLDQLESYRQ